MSVRFSELTYRVMAEVKQQNVRRCLFGRPNTEQLFQDLHKQDQIFQEADVRQFRERWGFDPVTGPLPEGPFEFEMITVDSNKDIPPFYVKDYTSRKSRHARMCIERSFALINGVGRPNLAKRKINLQGEENDENSEVLDRRVPNKGDIVDDPQLNHLPSVTNDCSGSTCGHLCGYSGGLTLPSSSSLLELLTSRNKDIMTPSARQKTFVQSSLKGEHCFR